MLKKLFSLSLSLFIVFMIVSENPVFAKNIEDYSKNSLIVTLKKKYSLPDVEYDEEFFASDYVIDVIDLMHVNLQKKGNKGHKSEKWQISLLLLLNTSNDDELKLAEKELNKHYAVEKVTKNYFAEYSAVSSLTTPDDYYMPALYAHRKIQTERAWSISTGSAAVRVGVIDSGIDMDHPDLVDNLSSSLHESFEITSSTNDILGHGTHVSGIIGAKGNNGIGVTGVCWNVQLISLRYTLLGVTATDFDKRLSIAHVVSAINYAEENGIEILNLSSGFDIDVTSLRNAIDNYEGLLVVAAGNDGLNTCSYPACYTYDNIITVIATDSSDNIASWSNYNSVQADIAAPGVDILSTDKNGNYKHNSGTSMAAPFVAGAAALMKSVNPNLTTAQIKTILMNSSDHLSGLIGKCVSGGRLNVFNAVLASTGLILGDVNFSGSVTASDAQMVLSASVGNVSFTKIQAVLADVDMDGVVDAGDAQMILQSSVS